MSEELTIDEIKARAKALLRSYESKQEEIFNALKQHLNLTDIVILAELFGRAFTVEGEAPLDMRLRVTFRVLEKEAEDEPKQIAT